MGQQATKAIENIWYQARKQAANYNDKLSSREGASELLGMSVSSLADTELGNLKFMPVDKAVLMADLYHAPELLNYYCLHECPIGCRQSISEEVCDLDRITVKLLSHVRIEQLNDIKDKLLEIASDGKITKEEHYEFFEIVDYLDGIAKIVSELKILSESIKNGRYHE